MFRWNNALFHKRPGEAERLINVLALQLRPLFEEIVNAHATAQVSEDRSDGRPEAPDAWLPETSFGVHGDAVKLMMTDLHDKAPVQTLFAPSKRFASMLKNAT